MTHTNSTFIALLLLIIALASLPALAQEEPQQVVARVQLKSPNNKEKPIFAEAGDILMVVSLKDDVALVQSPEGRRANVRRRDVVELSRSKPLYDQLIKDDPQNSGLYASRAMV